MSDAPVPQPTATIPADAAPAAVAGGAAATEETLLASAAAEAGIGQEEAAKEQAPAAVVPEKYEVKPPEIDGKPMELDGDALTAFEGQAREAGLTQAQFEVVTKFGFERIQTIAEARASEMVQQMTGLSVADLKTAAAEAETWREMIQTDPEIGGDKLPQSLGQVVKAMKQFFPIEFQRQATTDKRYGNNPHFIRGMVQIGKAMGDSDGLVIGKPAAGAKTADPEQRARNFFNEAGGSYAELTG